VAPNAKRRSMTDGDAAPDTLAGQYLWATAMRNEAEVDRLHVEMERIRWANFPSLAWATLIAASQAYFGPGLDIQDISSAVADMRRAFGDAVPVLEAEALIRLALGDDSIDTTGIGEEMMVRVATITVTSIADFWSQDETKVLAVFVEAEAMVKERGIELTPAP
jgi:hypothetical protein